MVRRPLLLLLALAATALGAPPAAETAGPALRVGVGRADITPPTGYVLGGWTRADRTGEGVHTRLYATALVLERGGRKVALVSVDLFAAPGGLVKEAAERNAGRGFSEQNVLVSASHTHSGPGGFANFDTFNTVAPSAETIGSPQTFVELLDPRPTDRQLYTFLASRIATAIREADDDLAPGAVGWGEARLTSVTKNRSLEAHLADHGLLRERGTARPEDDPEGAEHTIDPEVNVLRVDRYERRTVRCRRRGRVRRCRRRVRVPVGGWSSFANHGTVNPSELELYNQDHHGPANRRFEELVRAEGRVRRGRLVVNVYGNSNEGDQSAGLDGQGMEVAQRVGSAEGEAMFAAWREAGRRMTRGPALDSRWTRVCFCGQSVEGGGAVADEPLPGVPFLTGSEEGRGPLFDLTGVPLEGTRSPVEGFESQGHKVGIPGAASTASVPNAVPLMVVRIRDRVIATLPGEPTVEVGRRVRAAVLRSAGPAGVRRAIVAGLANEFILYLTTPEEYDRQHYEGGSTLYGPYAAYLLRDQLGELAGRLVRGEPAQDAYDFDPRNGVVADGQPYGDGAERGEIESQPRDAVAGAATELGWRGGPRGLDRPLDRAFVIVERETARGWRRVADDLGLQIVWRVDGSGRYRARWNVPAAAPAGRHRIRIEARRYTLESQPFDVTR